MLLITGSYRHSATQAGLPWARRSTTGESRLSKLTSGRRPSPVVIKRTLALVLREHGVSWRKARRIIDVVFDSIKEALKRHETVDLPFGTFSVVKEGRTPQRCWRLGRVRVVYRKRYRVVFTPRELEIE